MVEQKSIALNVNQVTFPFVFREENLTLPSWSCTLAQSSPTLVWPLCSSTSSSTLTQVNAVDPAFIPVASGVDTVQSMNTTTGRSMSPLWSQSR